LLTVAAADPSAFAFPLQMEEKYGQVKAKNEEGRKTFFRESRSAQDVLDMSNLPFTPYTDSTQRTIWDELLDIGGACSESCEIGADE
jgi:hypothetical protein